MQVPCTHVWPAAHGGLQSGCACARALAAAARVVIMHSNVAKARVMVIVDDPTGQARATSSVPGHADAGALSAVQPAFLVVRVLPPPASGARVVAGRDGARAGRTADRWVAL